MSLRPVSGRMSLAQWMAMQPPEEVADGMQHLQQRLAEGATVVARIKPSYYEQSGRFSFYCDAITPVGEGRLLARLESSLEATRAQAREYQDAALYDALTGLPNRTQFLQRLDAACRRHDRPEQLVLDRAHHDRDHQHRQRDGAERHQRRDRERHAGVRAVEHPGAIGLGGRVSELLKKNAATEADILPATDEYVRIRRRIEGRSVEEMLRERLPEIIESLRWPKMMRWGTGEHSFIRPIHSVISMFDGHHAPVSIFGIASGTRSTMRRRSS